MSPLTTGKTCQSDGTGWSRLPYETTGQDPEDRLLLLGAQEGDGWVESGSEVQITEKVTSPPRKGLVLGWTSDTAHYTPGHLSSLPHHPSTDARTPSPPKTPVMGVG